MCAHVCRRLHGFLQQINDVEKKDNSDDFSEIKNKIISTFEEKIEEVNKIPISPKIKSIVKKVLNKEKEEVKKKKDINGLHSIITEILGGINNNTKYETPKDVKETLTIDHILGNKRWNCYTRNTIGFFCNKFDKRTTLINTLPINEILRGKMLGQLKLVETSLDSVDKSEESLSKFFGQTIYGLFNSDQNKTEIPDDTEVEKQVEQLMIEFDLICNLKDYNNKKDRYIGIYNKISSMISPRQFDIDKIFLSKSLKTKFIRYFMMISGIEYSGTTFKEFRNKIKDFILKDVYEEESIGKTEKTYDDEKEGIDLIKLLGKEWKEKNTTEISNKFKAREIEIGNMIVPKN